MENSLKSLKYMLEIILDETSNESLPTAIKMVDKMIKDHIPDTGKKVTDEEINTMYPLEVDTSIDIFKGINRANKLKRVGAKWMRDELTPNK